MSDPHTPERQRLDRPDAHAGGVTPGIGLPFDSFAVQVPPAFAVSQNWEGVQSASVVHVVTQAPPLLQNEPAWILPEIVSVQLPLFVQVSQEPFALQ